MSGGVLTTSLTLSVGDGAGGSLNMVLEVPNQLVSFNGGIDVRLYPNVVAELATSHGGSFEYATPGVVGVLDVPKDFIIFEGETRKTSEYPATNTVDITKRWAIFYDEKGNRIEPSFRYDYATGEVVASEPCFGAVELSYETTYRRCTYTPKVTKSGLLSIKTYDTLLAFYDGSVATLKMTRDKDPNDERNYEQVFEIYTELVNDKDGPWEVPDGFPDTSQTYGGKDHGSAPRKKGYQTSKRVHAYLYVDPVFERIYKRIIRVRYEQPFPPATTETTSSWHPAYKVREDIPSEYEERFKEKIRKEIDNLKERYEPYGLT